MTFKEFFSKDYLFNPIPPSESRLYLVLIILFGILILFSVLIKIAPIKKSLKKFFDRSFSAFLTAGILGFVYLFCRYEELPWLGSRLFLLIILLAFTIWILTISIISLISLPKHKKEEKAEERYQKYLPERKRVSNK